MSHDETRIYRQSGEGLARDFPTAAVLHDVRPLDPPRVQAGDAYGLGPDDFGGDEYRSPTDAAIDDERRLRALAAAECAHWRVTVIGYGFAGGRIVSRIVACNHCGEIRRGCRIMAADAAIELANLLLAPAKPVR